jgi:hypothetical protein
MEAYRRQTLHIIELYLDGEFSFAECFSALDEALAAVFLLRQAKNLIHFALWRDGIAES